jgi:hypothetical protein
MAFNFHFLARRTLAAAESFTTENASYLHSCAVAVISLYTQSVQLPFRGDETPLNSDGRLGSPFITTSIKLA